MAIKAADIGITDDRLKESAHKFRKTLLAIPVIAVEKTTRYMTPRPGVTGKETVGELEQGDAQFGPYDPHRKTSGEKINPRTLETFFGSVIHEFDPNSVAGSVYASSFKSGEALKLAEVNKKVVANRLKVIGKNLGKAIWNAKRNDNGTKTAELFNGLDTIAQKEIDGGGLSVEKKNLFLFKEKITRVNAVDLIKSFCRAATAELKEEDELYLYCDPDIKELYEEAYKAETGGSIYNKEYEQGRVEGFGGKILFATPATKAGSGFIQLTSKSNMLYGFDSVSDTETLSLDRFSPFLITLSAAMWFGTDYESIAPEKLLVGKLYTE